MAVLLEVKNLMKYFPVTRGVVWQKIIGWVKAVDDISFSVMEGETFSLVGESGCGKTTTAKVILLLEQPNGGDVFLQGKDIFKLRGVGLAQYRSWTQAVFQDPYASLEPRMRVGSIVAEPLLANSMLSKGEIIERCKEVLNQVGVGADEADRFPHEFSGGQRQRIAIARALSARPGLIILDEPVSALDVSIRAQIMNLLKDLQEQLGISYLLIAHNLATVRYMSHRMGVMYLGKLIELGLSEELYSKPLHPYTKALISSALPSHPDMVQVEILLPGEVPSALDPPSGCRFHPRCLEAKPLCSEIEPELKEVGSNHYVACHIH